MSFNKSTTLEELFNSCDMTLLKKLIAELVERQDYKTLNTLLRRNQNVNMFDTRLLNEDIPQSDKRFVKRNGKLQNVTKYTNTYVQTRPVYHARIRTKYY